MGEQFVPVLSQSERGRWLGQDVATSKLLVKGQRKPLIVGLTGGFDRPNFYPGWESMLSTELGVDVEIPNFYDLDGVEYIGKTKRGPIYYADWHPADRINQIAKAIADKQPTQTVLLGLVGLGSMEAMQAAFALNALFYPIDGVVAIAPNIVFERPDPNVEIARPHSRIDPVDLHDTTPAKYRGGNLLKQRLSCVRYENPFEPKTGEVTTVHMHPSMRHRYRRPFTSVLSFGEQPEFSTIAELINEYHYQAPTAFVALEQTDYMPPERVRWLAKQSNANAPTEFIMVPDVNYDFRAYPHQSERVAETVIDVIGQLLTTRAITKPQPLSSLLLYGVPIALKDTREVISLSSARPPFHTKSAADLAETSGAELIIFASGDANPARITKDLNRRNVKSILITGPSGFPLEATRDFATATHPMAVEYRKENTLSAKRNAALVMSLLAALDSLAFLDDDIKMSPQNLHTATSALDSFDIAGFQPTSFPDNSVVRHACRLAGDDEQTVFISGSSLIVNPTRIDTFFPNVYNEDWLLISDKISEGKVVRIGEVEQLQYNPFDPKRAKAEEFGDVLAEGLYFLLQVGTSFQAVNEDFWREAMRRRRHLIATTAERLQTKLGNGDKYIPQALEALEASRAQLDLFIPGDFTSYIRDWRNDIERWRERISKLPQGMSIEEAVKFLKLDTYGLKK